MAEISIVVPVYNVEKYLRRCLESILGQTMRELEIILINDGSTDRSGEICEEYKERDNRIQVIHKKNGGLSDARNAGARIAASDYVIFLDSDDYIAQDMMETLYTLAKDSGADMSVCGVYNVYGEREIPQYSKSEEFICTGEEAFMHILEGKKIPGTICNKLIKRQIVQQIEFPAGRLYEDAFYTLDLVQRVENVSVTTRPMYYYAHRQDSITTSTFKEADLDIIYAYRKTLELVKKKYPRLMMQAVFRLFWAHFIVIDRILGTGDYKTNIYLKTSRRFLKRNIFRIIRNPYFEKKRRLAAILLFFNVNLYRKALFYNSRQLYGA